MKAQVNSDTAITAQIYISIYIYFTVLCFVTCPLYGSEDGVD